MNEIDLRPYISRLPVDGRVNHEGCPAGEDTRRRLYITPSNKFNGYVGFCHNCGNKGTYFRTQSFTTLSELLSDDDDHYTERQENTQTNVDYIYTLRQPITHLATKAWLYKYHTFEDDWDRLGLSEMSGGFGNLIIPLVGYGKSCQVRYFNKSASSKYVTFLEGGVSKVWANMHDGAQPTVVTEDVLSAYRCVRDLGVNAMALLGTNVDHKALSFFLPTDVYVWLDGDRTGLTKSVEVYKTLSVVLKNKCHIVSAEKSPKEYSPEELKEIWSKRSK